MNEEKLSFVSDAQICCLYFWVCTYILYINIYIHIYSYEVFFMVLLCCFFATLEVD